MGPLQRDPIQLLLQPFPISTPLQHPQDILLLRPEVIAAGLGIAVLSSVIPYSFELEALRRLPPRVFGVLMSLEPAAAAIAGLIVLDQVLKPNQWAGMALVIVASAGATRFAGSRVPAPRDA